MTKISADKTTTPFNVLFVDDDADILRTFGRFMRAKGHEIQLAASVAGALAVIEREQIEAVVTDLSMPGANGLELIRAIRERDVDLPVIVVTGQPDVESASEAVELRAFRYFTKPVDVERLHEALRRAVTTYRLVNVRRRAAETHRSEQDGASAEVERRFRSGMEGLWMAYQPLVAADTLETFGFEALLRTNEKTISHPGVFLEMAARLGTLHQLGRMTRSRAATDVMLRLEQGMLFVNLSAADLADPNLFSADAPLSRIASRVVLELTEREGLEGVVDVGERVAELRRLGFKIAIDDLGAGYSALSYFASLEPELVKLDMSLVRDIDQRPVKQRTVLSLVQLAHSLGIEVVAEGVETPAECKVLRSLECDYLQGFLFARPGPPFPVLTWRPDPEAGA
ncbi:MAG: EAL domain-containing protein [Sandaracinaceae bacterium]